MTCLGLIAARRRSAPATSAHVLATAGVPATWKAPGVRVEHDVGGVGLEQLGGQVLGLLDQFDGACCTAAPPCCSDREPMVPPPTGTRSVSPHTTSIMSIGMPVSSAAIIDHAVTWPWPWGEVPV